MANVKYPKNILRIDNEWNERMGKWDQSLCNNCCEMLTPAIFENCGYRIFGMFWKWRVKLRIHRRPSNFCKQLRFGDWCYVRLRVMGEVSWPLVQSSNRVAFFFVEFLVVCGWITIRRVVHTCNKESTH